MISLELIEKWRAIEPKGWREAAASLGYGERVTLTEWPLLPQEVRDEVRALLSPSEDLNPAKKGIQWTQKQQTIIDHALDRLKSGGIGVICGKRGTGKTSMAKEINRRMFEGRGRYELAQDYFQDVAPLIRGMTGQGREAMLGLQKPRLTTSFLILDEAGFVAADEAGARVLEDLVIRRHGKPTLLIANWSASSLPLSDTFKDRIKDGFLAETEWQSFRGKA